MNFIPYTDIQNIPADAEDYAVPTGFPSPAMEFLEQRISLKKLLIKKPLSTFFAFNENDAMEDVGIMHGSILVIEKTSRPRLGDVLVVFMNGEYYVRIYQLHKLKPRLVAANRKKNYLPIDISDESGMVVWGKVVDVVTHLKNTENGGAC